MKKHTKREAARWALKGLRFEPAGSIDNPERIGVYRTKTRSNRVMLGWLELDKWDKWDLWCDGFGTFHLHVTKEQGEEEAMCKIAELLSFHDFLTG